MGRVVWINGMFSAGKTSVAWRLADALPRAFVPDPEPSDTTAFDDTGGWTAQTVDRVLPELARSLYAEHVDTEGRSLDEVTATIRERLG